MEMPYDLLVVDLDGTLLGRNGDVSSRNRRALAQARECGLELIIATGRSLVESRCALDAVDHQGLVVAAGGRCFAMLRPAERLIAVRCRPIL